MESLANIDKWITLARDHEAAYSLLFACSKATFSYHNESYICLNV